MSRITIHLIVAARPNFMKVAPLYHALKSTAWANPVLVHTGQHYDRNMSDAIFEDLSLPTPDYHLGIGSGTHAEQTGNVMIAYEKICLENRPDWTIVVGDVNPTAACAMVCAKLWIPVVHLEAGLRSFDRKMPEEINRLVTDAIADVLWTPSEDGTQNLLNEGVAPEKIECVGNIMLDSFEMMRTKIESAGTTDDLGLAGKDFALVTLHRPSNVDQKDSLRPIAENLVAAAERLPVVFSTHPRTVKKLQEFGLYDDLAQAGNLQILDPVPYVKFMNLVTAARLVITDSGGIQEETTYLGIPCLTLRDNTERPITISQGTNKLVNVDTMIANLDQILSGGWPRGRRPAFWDGKTAERAVQSLRVRAGI